MTVLVKNKFHPIHKILPVLMCLLNSDGFRSLVLILDSLRGEKESQNPQANQATNNECYSFKNVPHFISFIETGMTTTLSALSEANSGP